MRLTLLESERSFFQVAECTFASTVLHAGIALLALGATADGRLLPADEREARAFFLLPPDRENIQSRQSDIFQLGSPGGFFTGGLELAGAGDDERLGGRSYGRPLEGHRSSALGEKPFGPPAFLSDSVFSILEVDEMVERFEGTAAPIYPEDLAARGTEGRVQTTYVVDATGRVDTTTIQVLQSDNPRFTESVRTALGAMRFRPAKKGGKTVRQLVQQRFNFRIAPPVPLSRQIS